MKPDDYERWLDPGCSARQITEKRDTFVSLWLGIAHYKLGASRVEQIEQNVAAIANLRFSPDELARIDAFLNAT